MSSTSSIVVNAAWRGQRVTGQQRYASEISSHLIEQADVVTRPTSTPQRREAAWAVAQLLGVPRSTNETLLTLTSRGPVWHPRHVVTVHDHFVLTNPEWYSPLYARTHAAVLRAEVKTAKGLVFVSEATRDEHHHMFGNKTPYVVAPNGVNVPVGIQPHEMPEGRPYLLAVASADPRKNIPSLVEAYAGLPLQLRLGCSLVLVGGQQSVVFGRHETKNNSVEGVVSLGYTDERMLWALYKGARAVVVPSYKEGFGLPLVEAAAVQTPVLISDIPVFRWIASNQAVYFDPNEVGTIRNALKLAATTRKSDLPIIREASKRFSWKQSADSILNFVRSLS